VTSMKQKMSNVCRGCSKRSGEFIQTSFQMPASKLIQRPLVTLEEKMQLCSGCNHVYFCSQSCLREHWSLHKAECRQAKYLEDREEKKAIAGTAIMPIDAGQMAEVFLALHRSALSTAAGSLYEWATETPRLETHLLVLALLHVPGTEDDLSRQFSVHDCFFTSIADLIKGPIGIRLGPDRLLKRLKTAVIHLKFEPFRTLVLLVGRRGGRLDGNIDIGAQIVVPQELLPKVVSNYRSSHPIKSLKHALSSIASKTPVESIYRTALYEKLLGTTIREFCQIFCHEAFRIIYTSSILDSSDFF
jgi:hypothetical protein